MHLTIFIFFLKINCLLFIVYCVFIQNTDKDKKDQEKGSVSPFDGSNKDDGGPQGNGLSLQNGLDDDKGFK